ncbi:MAG: DUF2167 domain-containing protein [Zoogloea sp.]|jgi:uncharacterized membrane-anchored protein|nr:DUF2167 domain-containing protein [Zoogloea sp.]TXG93219.1 MAG: DUF2167 domain-containing protein [Zoogloea sp.]
MHPVLRTSLVALSLLLISLPQARATDTPDPRARIKATAEAAYAALQKGPQDIALGEQGQLRLPEGYGFIPRAEATAVMEAQGNQVGQGFHGLVVGDKLKGFVSVRFEPSGYVKDEEAKDWNADALLQNLKDGTDATNERRRQLGLPEVKVLGWIEAPHYDAATHRLVWSAALQSRSDQDGTDEGVNFNTYVLGREGYFSMNLVTSPASIEQEKPAARELLAALDFNEGKRYADFNERTDKVAEYGLAALVGGIAAKKLGLLATLGVFLAKFWKIGALALVGLGAGARRLLGRKDSA